MRGRMLLGTVLVGVAFAAGASAKDWPKQVPTAQERGQELYDRHCLACHGPKAAGDGPAAASLVAKVPDLSQGFGAANPDKLVELVLRGRGAMPGFDQSFRDLKPYSEGVVGYARNVLDTMERLGRAQPPASNPADAPDDDEEEAGDLP